MRTSIALVVTVADSGADRAGSTPDSLQALTSVVYKKSKCFLQTLYLPNSRYTHCAMILNHNSYRSVLKARLAEMIGKNPRYSLRAFARSLGIDASYLSSLISGKKNLSPELAAQIGIKLGLSGEELEYFTLLADYERTQSPEVKQAIASRLRKLSPQSSPRELSVELFQAISEWYHLPIIALCDTAEFDFNSESVSHYLGISKFQAEAAIERLERLEMIEKDLESGRYTKTIEWPVFSSPITHGALNRFYQGMLERAGEALRQQPSDELYNGSERFAFDSEQMPEARALTNEYLDKMVALASHGKRKTEAYHLSVQLFNLRSRRGKSSKFPKNPLKPGSDPSTLKEEKPL